MRSLWRLLRTRPGFRWLWLGETISLIGDWLSYVAVSILALQAGEGAFGLALVFAAHILPTALVAPVAGIVTDRIDKRRLLVGTQIVMALLMVVMVAAAWSRSLWAVQGLLFLRTTVAGFFYPAKQAALRALVQDDELVSANAIDAATWSVTFTLGTALGGVVAMAGPVLALVVDTFTFVVAAAVLAQLPTLPSAARAHEPVRIGELVAALRLARRHDGLLEAVFTKAPLAAAGGAGWVLLNLTAFDVSRHRTGLFASAALVLGALQAIRGVGTGVGPMLARGLLHRGAVPRTLLRLSAWVTLASVGAFTLATSSNAGLVLIGATVLLWGMGGGGSWVFSATEVQSKSPVEVLGRLSAMDMLTFTFGQGAGALAAGYLVDSIGRASSAGWLGLGLGVVSYAALRMTLRAQSAHTVAGAFADRVEQRLAGSTSHGG